MRQVAPLFVLLLPAACIDLGGLSLGGSTRGVNGRLSFAYESSQCALGCSLDSAVLQGSLIAIEAHGADPSGAYTMAVVPPSMGIVTSNQTCVCTTISGNSPAVTPVDAAQSCAAGQSKSCLVIGAVQTAGAGTATLQVLDGAQHVVDAVMFTIAPANRIQQTVTVNNQPARADAQGTYAVRVGDRISITSAAYSGSQELVFTTNGLAPSFSNPDVVAPDSDLLGATGVEDAYAKAAGDASVTMTAVGASATITAKVSPP
jgi:hypothetical protein